MLAIDARNERPRRRGTLSLVRRLCQVPAVGVLTVAAQRVEIGELGRRVLVGAARDQELDGVYPAGRGGEDQRGLEAIALLRVDGRALVNERRDRGNVPSRRR